MRGLDQFCKTENGAVTVDWVVMTAAIVGLGIAVVIEVRSGLEDLAGEIEASLSGATVTSSLLFDSGSGATQVGGGQTDSSASPDPVAAAANPPAHNCPPAFPNCDGVNPPPMNNAPGGGQPDLVAPTPPGRNN